MAKLFYSSYVICALLALLHLVIIFSSYVTGDVVIYHSAIVLYSGGTSFILLVSIFFPLKAKIAAMLIFAVSMIGSYTWDRINWPFNPMTMSFFDGILEASLFLIFVLVPILGFVSGASILGKNARLEE